MSSPNPEFKVLPEVAVKVAKLAKAKKSTATTPALAVIGTTSILPDNLANHQHNPKKAQSEWVTHVKAKSAELGITYGNAMRHADVKSSYKSAVPKSTAKVSASKKS
jgi:hypothetical protein